MLVNLGNGTLSVYQTDFEEPFLLETREFCRVSTIVLDEIA